MGPKSQRGVRNKGLIFERLIAHYFSDNGYWVVREGSGSNNGDMILPAQSVMVECKNTVKTELAVWMKQAEGYTTEGATIPVLVHKRKGVAEPEKQWVTTTLKHFSAILGEPPAAPQREEIEVHD